MHDVIFILSVKLLFSCLDVLYKAEVITIERLRYTG